MKKLSFIIGLAGILLFTTKAFAGYSIDFKKLNGMKKTVKPISLIKKYNESKMIFALTHLKFIIKGKYNHSIYGRHTYGRTKWGMQTLIFNIIDPEYRNALNSVMTQSSAIAAESMMNTFWNRTDNRTYDYQMVMGYYGQLLNEIYGNIQTSFLRYIGLGLHTDITYPTILLNTNYFLSKITMTRANKHRFIELLKTPNIHNLPETGISVINPALSVFTSGGLAIKNNYLLKTRGVNKYYKVSRKSINFYSVDYYLIKNIITGSNKKISAKLLTYIITGRYVDAERLFFSIPVYIKKNPDNKNALVKTINNFLNAINNNNFIAANNIANNIEQAYQSWLLKRENLMFACSNSAAAAGDGLKLEHIKPRLYLLMKSLINFKEYRYYKQSGSIIKKLTAGDYLKIALQYEKRYLEYRSNPIFSHTKCDIIEYYNYSNL